MSAEQEPRVNRLEDPRVYLAVERTFLAWIRTGLALMGFGFVVARFGLFLREIATLRPLDSVPPHSLSARFGTALVLLGVVLTITSVIRYVQLLKRLELGDTLVRPSRTAVALGSLLAILGMTVSVYLLLSFW
ncbi:MAG TPA: DUF202 domain-containing protein [Bryobacteraceae bacterium]|nr:DUF202 domain-containing protein [Bryobacteraceae bacterium]